MPIEKPLRPILPKSASSIQRRGMKSGGRDRKDRIFSGIPQPHINDDSGVFSKLNSNYSTSNHHQALLIGSQSKYIKEGNVQTKIPTPITPKKYKFTRRILFGRREEMKERPVIVFSFDVRSKCNFHRQSLGIFSSPVSGKEKVLNSI